MQLGHFRVNVTMQSLQTRLKDWRAQAEGACLLPVLEVAQAGKAAHVSGVSIPCPVRLLYGEINCHSSNGMFVISQDNTVYAQCTTCQFCPKLYRADKSLASVLGDSENPPSHYPWIVWTEEQFKAVMRQDKQKRKFEQAFVAKDDQGKGGTTPCPVDDE